MISIIDKTVDFKKKSLQWMSHQQAQSYSVSSISELKMWCGNEGFRFGHQGWNSFCMSILIIVTKMRTRRKPELGLIMHVPTSPPVRMVSVLCISFTITYERRTRDNPKDLKSMTNIAIAHDRLNSVSREIHLVGGIQE